MDPTQTFDQETIALRQANKRKRARQAAMAARTAQTLLPNVSPWLIIAGVAGVFFFLTRKGG